jgi:transcription termination/antitermination protein NusG
LTTDPPLLSWYAVWTRSRAEKAVHDQLVRKDVEVFLPTVTRWSRWRDRRKQIDWPLFPGYCFARFDPRNLLQVVKCTGVATVVSFDGKLAPVPDVQVEAIRTLVTSGLQYDPCPFINEGDLVEVIHGPLRGVTGRLMRKGPHARLVLSVEMINRSVAVTVEAADIRQR